MGEIKTWQAMADTNAERLQRTTGRSVEEWVEAARGAGVDSRAALAAWLKAQGVTGYSLMSVDWAMFGYPDFILRSGDELYEGQYADRQALRPIGDRLLAWALDTDGVEVQMRKTYISLQTARRKFAQVTPATKSAVDVFLRFARPNDPRAEPARAAKDDPFRWRIRLKTVDDIDDAVLQALTAARDESL
ncbi:DUF5655 domain-containing protein [Arthrobacter zhaoguopingii]|uniref:DUF5655 domain-containing protein n=1 Tax=Arthrobacter zhaoguopingii TaxID=2681491 RepID=UPI001359AE7F|nr:DUF5655 domain-containing protein [Arthrobacter zhaoguopingii]